MANRAREPVVAYHATPPRPAAGEVRAKLFANGRSQAVRLPKEFRMPGSEVLVHRDGDRLILEPIREMRRDAKGWPIGLWDWLDSFDEEFPDPEPMPVRFLEPEEIEPLDDVKGRRRGRR